MVVAVAVGDIAVPVTAATVAVFAVNVTVRRERAKRTTLAQINVHMGVRPTAIKHPAPGNTKMENACDAMRGMYRSRVATALLHLLARCTSTAVYRIFDCVTNGLDPRDGPSRDRRARGGRHRPARTRGMCGPG